MGWMPDLPVTTTQEDDVNRSRAGSLSYAERPHTAYIYRPGLVPIPLRGGRIPLVRLIR
jgi:hypothetical protein